MIYFVIILLVLIIADTVKDSLKYLHIIQLEGYKNNQYLGWIKKNYFSRMATHIIFLLFSLAVFILLSYFNIIIAFSAFLLGFSFHIILDIMLKKIPEQKKKLVYTNRLKRLIVTLCIIEIFEIFLVFCSLFYLLNNTSTYLIFVIFLGLLMLIIPFNILIANYINFPIEKLNNNRYKKDAKRILQSHENLKVIGITGSYGKTSTKNFINDILSVKYKVLITPESYNTPMGLCKVIRGELNDKHEIFVAEMGARYPNDIKEICDFVNPSIGVLTSIGPQHLETFKSMENITKEKFKLIQSLPTDGFAVLNGDNKESLDLIDNVKTSKMIFGIDNKNVDIFANDIEYNNQGMKITINVGQEKIYCVTKVLGLHNVSNILSAVCVAKYLGLSNDEIVKGIENIKSVEHRLQIIPTNNGITVIDDAFNSNPLGSKMALDVISKFSGNKIIITPGMIELGEKEFEYNKEFGRKIGEVCNYAILVGKKRSVPIAEGIKETNFSSDNIIIVSSLNEASKVAGSIAKAGDVLLFENDLPDNYNE